MKKQVFAVCDPEEEYTRNFVDYLSRKKNIPFDIHAFTSAQMLLAYAKENRIELLLISPEAMCGEIRELDVGKLIILNEGIHPPELGCYAGVYKYQSSSRVIREVLAYYGEEKAVLPVHDPAMKRGTEIFGIYSPLGRCLKTSFALTLGQILGKSRSVLYLNLEEYSGFEELLGCSFRGTLSDLLYYIHQGDQDLIARMNGMVQTEGVLDFIPPVRSPADIRGTPCEDWICLLREIASRSPYEVLILDIGNGIDEVFQILEMCGTVFMPVLQDRVSESKVSQFENLLKMLEYPQILAKTVKMSLPRWHGCQKGVSYMDQLVWGELGDYVRELIRKEEICTETHSGNYADF